MLDQSGSMSANFKGQCDQSDNPSAVPPAQAFPGEPARFWQCATGPLNDTDGDGLGDTAAPDSTWVTGTGMVYAWGNRDERRITIAKKAIETLVGLTNMPGNPQYTPAHPSDQMALVWFNEAAQRDGNNEVFANGTPFSDNPAELIARMWDRSTHPSGDDARTAGGTNGTAGLYRAGLILDSVPREVVYTDGQTYTYRPVVLFITDGVTNQFFHPSRSDLRIGQSNSSTYPAEHPCRALGDRVLENADCQTTGVGGVYTTTIPVNGATQQVGLDRPVSQLVAVSQEILQRNGYAVVVLALSDFPTTGLPTGVASSPTYYRSVRQLIVNPDETTNVDQAIRDLPGFAPVEERCSRGVAPGWVTQVSPQNRPEEPGLGFPNVGQVQLVDAATGVSYTAPITVAEPDGAMSYRIARVPAGTYALTARLWYRGDDGVTRAYEAIDVQGQLVPALTVTLTWAETEIPPLALRLRGDVCATP